MKASYSLLVSWFIPYLQDLQPTYIGVIFHLLSTMDISVRVDIQNGPQNQLYKEWNNSTYYRGEITPATHVCLAICRGCNMVVTPCITIIVATL